MPGEAEEWIEFDVTAGLEALRDRVGSIPANTGITMIGSFGLTSHLADVVRRAGVPTRLPA